MATATTPEIQFNPDGHIYTLDGQRVLSVTQVLDGAGLVPSWCKSKAAAQRGKAVHAATHFLDENDLNWATLDPDLIGYVQAWARFKEEAQFTPLIMEHLVGDSVYGYAGTFDRQGVFNDTDEVLLDMKTGPVPASARLQLAAYGNAYITPKLWKRVAIQLKPDGSYSLDEPYPADEFKTDLEDFLACLRVAQFKQRRGLWKPE